MLLMSSLVQWLGRASTKTLLREKPFIIGITGSVGKSSTCEAIAAILLANDPTQHVRSASKNYNNELGIPLTVFDQPAPGRSIVSWFKLLWTAFITSQGLRSTGIRTFIFEMGADKPGDIAYLTQIAPPSMAVVTGITPWYGSLTPVHASQYASIEDVAKEKSMLVQAVQTGGTVILNADDVRVFAMRHMTPAHIMTFGETDAASVRLVQTHIVTEAGPHGQIPTGLEVKLERAHRHDTIFIPRVFGRSIAYALAAAMTVAESLDLSQDASIRLQDHFHPLPGRTRIIPGIKYTTLFDDTYNSSPVAVLSALQDLVVVPRDPHQRRVACIGEMRELGETSFAMHRLIGAEVAKLGIDLFVPCGKLAHAMMEGALANGMTQDRVTIFEDTPEAGRFIQQWIKPGDIILAKSSQGAIDTKGVRMERIIKELMAEPERAADLLVRQETAWKRI